jgi:hypothetical protein
MVLFVRTDLEVKTVPQLKNIAKTLQLKGVSKLKKAEMINAILNNAKNKTPVDVVVVSPMKAKANRATPKKTTSPKAKRAKKINVAKILGNVPKALPRPIVIENLGPVKKPKATPKRMKKLAQPIVIQTLGRSPSMSRVMSPPRTLAQPIVVTRLGSVRKSLPKKKSPAKKRTVRKSSPKKKTIRKKKSSTVY